MVKIYPTWTARIPPEVKEYLQVKKGLSAGQCLCEYYRILKDQELPEAEKKLAEHKHFVTHYEEIVTQLKQKNEEKQKDSLLKVKGILKSASFPEYYIGKKIEGVTITREFYRSVIND